MTLQELLDDLEALRPLSAREAQVVSDGSGPIVAVRYEGGEVVVIGEQQDGEVQVD